MKRDITIKFVDFWETFDKNDNKFLNALSARHNVTVLDKDSNETPDILFYSRSGNAEHFKYDCLKVYFTGENDFPDFNECDYAISFYDINFGHRHLRYPLYMLYEYDQIESPIPVSDSDALSRNFCSLVMRNSYNCDPERLKIIDAVEAYKPLSYGGPYRNNVGGPVADKIPFIAGYKFNLALENSMVEGYVTEKILEPLVASTVPIYWGSNFAKKDFNPDAFINIEDFDSLPDFIKYLEYVDTHDSEYLKILRSPKLRKETTPDFDSQLIDFLDYIATNLKRQVPKYGETRVIRTRNKLLLPQSKNKWIMKGLKLTSKLFD